MTTLLRTTAAHPDFRRLTGMLDEYLAMRNGAQHDFYNRFNAIDPLIHCVVAFFDEQAAGCGALRPADDGRCEIKRMYVLPECRGKGIATAVLEELERWAVELGFSACRLETGITHTDAVGLYRKAGYATIPNYGPYAGVDNSICMQKKFIA
jgi:putative acetyltransferase